MAKTLLEKIEAGFEDLKKHFSATQKPAEAEANDTILKDIKAQIDLLKGEVTAKDGEIKTLKDSAAKDKETIAARDLEITGLKAKDENAGKKAANILAGQGVDGKELPKADTKQTPSGKSLQEQYAAMLETDPRAAGAFFAEHSAKPEFWK